MTAISYSLQLEIKGINKILVPGCEPSSSMSSRTLAAYMATGQGCKNALVDLNIALQAIPGSYVKLGNNFNKGIRQKWFVLPPIELGCPCLSHDDYYNILRNLPGTELPVEEEFDKCDIIGMGYCPSPDFNDVPAPPTSTYNPEGSFPVVGGVLPPVPPWAL
jgi:hypothetical protein